MTKKRMRITINFKDTSSEETELYNKLQTYSNTSSIIKDILLGKLPVSILDLSKEASKFEIIDVKELLE